MKRVIWPIVYVAGVVLANVLTELDEQEGQ